MNYLPAGRIISLWMWFDIFDKRNSRTKRLSNRYDKPNKFGNAYRLLLEHAHYADKNPFEKYV